MLLITTKTVSFALLVIFSLCCSTCSCEREYPRWFEKLDLDNFAFSNGEAYYATGFYKTQIYELGYQGPARVVEFAINPEEQKMFINLTGSQYYMYQNESFIILDGGICYKVANFTYQSQIDYYAVSVYSHEADIDHFEDDISMYTGHVVDVGSCGYMAVTMGLNKKDRLSFWSFQQFYPAGGFPQKLVGGPIYLKDHSRNIPEGIFDLPNSCNVQVYDYCSIKFPQN